MASSSSDTEILDSILEEVKKIKIKIKIKTEKCIPPIVQK